MKENLYLVSCLVVASVAVLADVDTAMSQPPKPKDGPLGMKFVPLPKGTFYMGGGGGKAGKKTEIKEDFEIAVHPVTQEQWQAVMGKNPSRFSREGAFKDQVMKIDEEDLKQFPVENVSWNDAQHFIKKLNEKEAGRGYTYRLPAEAEWEYACRGGATSEEECSFHFYLAKPTNDLSSNEANFIGRFPAGKADKGPDLRRPTKVGSYPPNKLGLYDIHGNVCQWCADLYDPKLGGSYMVLRGGSFSAYGKSVAAGIRSFALEYQHEAFIGVRLVRVRAE
jgi:formylglycine-generating enzyme required for sulfatase activity